ncbi:protein O-linked-mannose beta-1,2-N-acetylglucosaminyltransferase 1-like [Macrobrachium nipponense]|uniref:protein O-linked-mannose beta-1,2-N-acetylglucosaminyltransferase 1-like n=1 Tax=Macrobrachium nipponense TaxID=159736 RepID=UPI0030C82772
MPSAKERHSVREKQRRSLERNVNKYTDSTKSDLSSIFIWFPKDKMCTLDTTSKLLLCGITLAWLVLLASKTSAFKIPRDGGGGGDFDLRSSLRRKSLESSRLLSSVNPSPPTRGPDIREGNDGKSSRFEAIINTSGLFVWLQEKQIYSAINNTVVREGKVSRYHGGIHVIVLHEKWHRIMRTVQFHTWQPASHRMLTKAMQEIQDGRIVIFLGVPEYTTWLTPDAAQMLADMHSHFGPMSAQGEAWVMAVRKGHEVIFESIITSRNVTAYDVSPLICSATIPVFPERACAWHGIPEMRERALFCDRYEGYGDFCRCQNPSNINPRNAEADWDLWVRKHHVDIKHQVIIPEVPRTKHEGGGGVHVTGYEQELSFHQRPYNLKPNVTLNMIRLWDFAYALDIMRILDKATTVNITQHPCDKHPVPRYQKRSPLSHDSGERNASTMKDTAEPSRQDVGVATTVTLEASLSSEGVTVKVDGAEVYKMVNKTHPWGETTARLHAGIHLLILHQKSGAVMRTRNFYTWQPELDRQLSMALDDVRSREAGCTTRRSDEGCSWYSRTSTMTQRGEFCEKYDGYGDFCSCENPSEDVGRHEMITYGEDSIPVAIVTAKRLWQVVRQVGHIRRNLGGEDTPITLFVDGHNPEARDLGKVLNVSVAEHNNSASVGSTQRINNHVKFSLEQIFERNPEVNLAIILEDDLELAPDFISYFRQVGPLLLKDPSLSFINAFNYNSYSHTASDPTRLYRGHGIPGYGWITSRRAAREMLGIWAPTNNSDATWDWWIRAGLMGSKDMIVPEVPRTRHMGGGGVHISGYDQILFSAQPLSNLSYVEMNTNSMTKDEYDFNLRQDLARASEVQILQHPCDALPLPTNKTGDSYAIYIHQPGEGREHHSYYVVSLCLGINDRDPHESYNLMTTFSFYGNQVFVIACPHSPYCSPKNPRVIYRATEDDALYAKDNGFPKATLDMNYAFRSPPRNDREQYHLQNRLVVNFRVP